MDPRLSEINIQQLTKFRSRPVEKLIREDLGTAGFATIEDDLEVIFSKFNELITIYETYDKLPPIYAEGLFYYLEEFNEIAFKLINYNVEEHRGEQKQRIISEIKKFRKYLEIGIPDGASHNHMPFITLSLVMQQFKFIGFTGQIDELTKAKKNYKSLEESSAALLSSLQEKAKAISLHDYATVFSKQSKMHSNWGWKPGASQAWLFVTLGFIGLFVLFIYKVDTFYPIKVNGVSATVITIQYITRALIISFQIYIISFCAKQFNIQQHLATVNKHRENTLNSYKLFIDSLGDTDTAIKPALMMEVAKAIYDSGQTGYLGSNDKSDNSTSMIEMTKYISSNK
jgi:hypothetical protein